MDKNKSSYKFGKFLVALLGTSVGIYIVVIIILLLCVVSVVGLNSDSVSGEGENYSIKPKLIENYKNIRDELSSEKGVNIPLKYIYAVDSVIKEGDFSNEDEQVTGNDLTCLYNSETKKVYTEKEKIQVYDCFDYSDYEIQLFEYAVAIYEKIGDNDDSSIGGEFLRPIARGVVTNEFMGDDLSFSGEGHTGIDLANAVGEPIYATASGEVIRAGFQIEAGNNVIIKHNINGKKFVSFYGHMNKTPLVKVGDKVTSSTKLGEIGATGNVTGPHLHFEIMVDTQSNDHSKAVNPREYIDFPKLGQLFTDRGDSGSVIDENKKKIMKDAGVNENDYKHVDYIVTRESTWNYKATNASSGAYGLCQALPPEKLATAGEDWRTNPVTQMKWCNTYAHERYGSWAKAEEWWRSNHWW